jgi:hypothetical protein
MRLISHEHFTETAENASIRIIDGQVHVNSVDVMQFKWEERIDFVIFAKLALETMTSPEQILFFHEHGIWPSSENGYLFKLVMRALLNEDIASPAQRYFHFSSVDRDAARTLLQIGLQSGWGGLLFGGHNNWFYFNHDGFGMIQSSVDVAKQLGSMAGLTIVPSTFRTER